MTRRRLMKPAQFDRQLGRWAGLIGPLEGSPGHVHQERWGGPVPPVPPGPRLHRCMMAGGWGGSGQSTTDVNLNLKRRRSFEIRWKMKEQMLNRSRTEAANRSFTESSPGPRFSPDPARKNKTSPWLQMKRTSAWGGRWRWRFNFFLLYWNLSSRLPGRPAGSSEPRSRLGFQEY